jgi:hypothetical protein
VKTLLLLAALVAVVAQQPDPSIDADGHQKAEHQIPAGDYCKHVGVPIGPKETHAHACACTYACHIDQNGNVSETGGEKSTNCKAYCSKDGRRCTCHPEEPCDLGSHVALKDMNHVIVAVTR